MVDFNQDYINKLTENIAKNIADIMFGISQHASAQLGNKLEEDLQRENFYKRMEAQIEKTKSKQAQEAKIKALLQPNLQSNSSSHSISSSGDENYQGPPIQSQNKKNQSS